MHVRLQAWRVGLLVLVWVLGQMQSPAVVVLARLGGIEAWGCRVGCRGVQG